jgi:hypothetical protein
MALVVGVVVDFAVEMVKCVSDGADVTDVNI